MNSLACMDLSATPQRYLRREWKRNKPHLRASDSLPSLRLCPNRPLFVCARCGFSNTSIPMCLWCAWSSATAKRKFEEKLPRPRRMSAPSMQNPLLRCERARVKYVPGRVSEDSSNSSAGPITPQGDLMFCGGGHQVPVITAVPESRSSGLSCSTAPEGVQTTANVMPDAHEIYPQGDCGAISERVATATLNPSSKLFPFTTSVKESLLDGPDKHEAEHRVLKKQSIRHRRKLPALFLATHTRATPHPHDSSRKSPTITRHDMTSLHSNTSSVMIDASRAADGDVYIGRVSHALSLLSVSTVSSQCSPNHKLRRKKRMPLLKSMSSLSFRSQSQQSLDDGRAESPIPHATQAPRVALTPSPAHSPPRTPASAEPPVRIGHPNRPYYTVIRKNMSRPGTPVCIPRTPSPNPCDHDYAPRATKSLDCGERTPARFSLDSRPMSMVMPGQVNPVNVYSGFSLSGETEMRMNLARWRKEDAPDEPGDYLFKETGRCRHDVLKGRVKKFGKSLRDLMLGRS